VVHDLGKGKMGKGKRRKTNEEERKVSRLRATSSTPLAFFFSSFSLFPSFLSPWLRIAKQQQSPRRDGPPRAGFALAGEPAQD
jgi:hypothetical protein